MDHKSKQDPRPELKIISTPYWETDVYDGAAMFTLFYKLECERCNFKCTKSKDFIAHLLHCMSAFSLIKASSLALYEKYGIVPKAVMKALDEARSIRDHFAVCIAPVKDHEDFIDLKFRLEKEDKGNRKKKSPGLTVESPTDAKSPTDGQQVYSKIWIETPLSSDIATLLLAGFKLYRHSPTEIHIPIYNSFTDSTHVFQLNMEQLENKFIYRNGHNTQMENELRRALSLSSSMTVPDDFMSFSADELLMIAKQFQPSISPLSTNENSEREDVAGPSRAMAFFESPSPNEDASENENHVMSKPELLRSPRSLRYTDRRVLL